MPHEWFPRNYLSHNDTDTTLGHGCFIYWLMSGLPIRFVIPKSESLPFHFTFPFNINTSMVQVFQPFYYVVTHILHVIILSCFSHSLCPYLKFSLLTCHSIHKRGRIMDLWKLLIWNKSFSKSEFKNILSEKIE